MPMTDGKALTVKLGNMQDRAEERVRSGAYASISDVLQAGLRALDREEEAVGRWMRDKIQESLADPRPSIPAEKVFSDLRAHHAAQMEADKRGR
jgi:antitoxin ParD1/3/4